MNFSTLWMPLVSLALFTGCTTVVSTEDESVAEAVGAEVSTNEVDPNGFSDNGFSDNGLVPSGIGESALNLGAMNEAVVGAIRNVGADGDSARQFLRYLVICAFDKTQSFSYSWTDATGTVHHEQYFGHLGVAPDWATEPLDTIGKQDVTACMAAHVNYYGTHVLISVRSAQKPLRLHPEDSELDLFPNIEGAFWGNMWSNNPYVYACYNSANVSYSRSSLRDCATGHVNSDGTVADCGRIHVVGSCEEACAGFNPASEFYTQCQTNTASGHIRTKRVVTTALP